MLAGRDISGFSGQLIGPGDEGYDEARGLFNAMIDRRPRLIARCASAADVAAVINFARSERVPMSVYGGGHSVTGAAVVEVKRGGGDRFSDESVRAVLHELAVPVRHRLRREEPRHLRAMLAVLLT
ncbi:MAG: FAD-binding protein, partial [Propionicimonas sp.]